MAGRSFSTDMGRDVRPGASPAAGGLTCDQAKEPNPGAGTGTPAGLYTAEFPMATAAQGQTLRWRWPAKNHATVGTQRGVQVYLSSTANAGDVFPTAATATDIYAQMDFSNCDPRQANVDNADCQDEFAIKTTTPPGRYTIMWWWEFNAGEYYNTCADILITAATGTGTGTGTGGTGGGGTVGTGTGTGTGTGIGGGGGIGALGPPPPPPPVPLLSALEVLAGQCQTQRDNLQLNRQNFGSVAEQDAYCTGEAPKVANGYSNLAELQGKVDFAALASATGCTALLAALSSTCSAMSGTSAASGGALAGTAGGGGGGVSAGGAGVIVALVGLAVGVLLCKCVLPAVAQRQQAQPPPPPPGAPPAKTDGGLPGVSVAVDS